MDRNDGETEYTKEEKEHMIENGYYFHDKIAEMSHKQRTMGQPQNRKDKHRFTTFLPYMVEPPAEGPGPADRAPAPYRCELCEKNFFSEDSFKLHGELHKDGNKYLCEFCGAGFSTKKDRRTHRKDKSGPWSCDAEKWKKGVKRWWLTKTPRKSPKPDIHTWMKNNLGRR